jgi:hypothetical protein
VTSAAETIVQVMVLRLRMGTTMAEVFGSQYADHASINLRRFCNASLRR